MKSWWIRAYAAMFVLVSAGVVLGIVQSCPQMQDLGPAFGCGDSVGVMSWSWHFIFWLVASSVVTLIGLVTVFAHRRRPTAASFVVWGSAGLLELAPTVSQEIRPRGLEISPPTVDAGCHHLGDSGRSFSFSDLARRKSLGRCRETLMNGELVDPFTAMATRTHSRSPDREPFRPYQRPSESAHIGGP